MSRVQWIGGQAVLEGVMMRHRNWMAIACRRGDNSIGLHREQLNPLAGRFPPLGWPLLRGAVSFFESLILGVRALNISAAQALAEEGEELKGWHSFVIVFLGLGLGIGLFFVLPTYLARFLPPAPPILLNLMEGFIRLFIFFSYLFLITRWGDVQRFFQYHGAEHKVIYCYEDAAALDPDHVKPYSTKHPRCGTSFILTVMIISILLFSLFGWPLLWQRIVIRLALLPLVAGLSYEAIRLTAGSRSPLVGLIALPGLWLQRMTTREPDKGQIEVAISALKAVLDAPADFTTAGQTVSGEEVADA
ncbi:MAG: DUF1385 domain-containing protein [Bacillota bacterium]